MKQALPQSPDSFRIRPPSEEDDGHLAKEAPRNPQAFAALYRRHLNAIYRYNLARTGNPEDAQDLTSQTFLAAYEAIGTYRGQASFLAWLFGIASRKLADHYRRGRPEAELADAESMPLPALSLEEQAADSLRLAQVAAALRALPGDQAQALTLRFFGGLSVAQASSVMMKSEAAVKMLVYRGIRALRQRLEIYTEVLQ